ncbi:S-layer homology domain-containing protein [Paenibacillus spongiae]|uniref:S-layer homology domain-containing protein n=1 Tax=Paenibacillus spongiae TaxID=2909671 RepID=A0ABY5S7M6_9BACL|nr:S-layer homology domain-containing protein [Paenibacillus spongiae]UVI29917.1 S-layer homology domain-containing protein [Paenibacillus spongiae]
MIKKLGMWLVMLALVVQLLPAGSVQTATAAVGNFNFPGESDVISSPRVTTDERITLSGTLSNVDPKSISYNVYQIINPATEEVGNKRENLTSNVSVNGFAIQIFNIQLFPGLNKITFKGTQSGGEVSNSIYVDYRNGPMLYDLTASLDGNNFPVVEDGTTVVQSQTSRGKGSADISITGKAPNAQQVTIIVNGSSKTYSVNNTNNNTFAASPITLQKGKNLVTIKISNGTQVIETTRDIAFYNGSVTFFDVNINEDGTSNSASIERSPNFAVSAGSNLTLTGKVIVPNSPYADPGDPTIKPHPNPIPSLGGNPDTLLGFMAYSKKVSDSAFNNISGNITYVKVLGNPAVNDKFFTYEYRVDLGPVGSYAMDELYNIKLTTRNEENIHNNLTPTDEGTDALFFTLRDKNKPFISQINYLPGYKSDNYEGIEGVSLNGKNLHGLPVGIEVLIANPTTTNSVVTVTDIKNASNISANPVPAPAVKPLVQDRITKIINGEAQTFQRVVLEFAKMPFEGTQTILMNLNTNSVISQATFTLLYGPYVNYTKMYDGMTIYDDTTRTTGDRIKDIIFDSAAPTPADEKSKLGLFEGELQNINNTSEIRYDATVGPRTVYFYINNKPFELVPINGANDTRFKLKADLADEALDAMFSGENIIKLVFQGSKTYYEKAVKVNLIPTNLPVIPVESAGVYPFTYQDTVTDPKPIPNDPKFPKQGAIFTTTEPYMNIFGTFDFIDLGRSLSEVNSNMTRLLTPGTSGTRQADDYIFKITGSTLTNDIVWKLSDTFQVVDGDTVLGMYPASGSITGDLVVRYDVKTESFSFILKRQELTADGSSSVYVFNVYNSGETGPKATYRLEVDPTVLPYKILRPYLPAEAIVNKNFVDVIINAKGANKVTINKQVADKYEYDYNNDGVIQDGVDYPHAFKATVSGLKPGKNKISFTIESGTDKVTNFFEITYTPTSIPGAQLLEEMKNSNKVFDGALTLTFPKGTSLIRRDYNVPSEFKGQVFTGHKLMFAIANPEDGVVDRREYDNPPAGFDLIMQNFGTRFRVSFPTRFTKSSPVFWIDSGLADDLSTPGYDPLTQGVDPYQYPGAKGPNNTKIPTYDERPDDRELVASKRGTLTLSYDPSMRDGIGTIVSVFRYDVKNKFWVNLGGVVDTKKNTITVPFDQFGYYVVGKMVYSFADVTNHPYARNYMEAIFSKGVMNAANFDDFGADLFTSRGEFARMVVKGLEIPLNYELSKPHFDDVPPIINQDALWDYSYIETAARNGIIRGTQPRAFEPSTNLSRAEAAVILARALELKLETDPVKIDKGLQKIFKDYGDISYYAKSSVLAIAKKGYIQGSPVDANDKKKGYVFEPQSQLLRSDAAIIIGKVLADQKRLPKLN